MFIGKTKSLSRYSFTQYLKTKLHNYDFCFVTKKNPIRLTRIENKNNKVLFEIQDTKVKINLDVEVEIKSKDVSSYAMRIDKGFLIARFDFKNGGMLIFNLEI